MSSTHTRLASFSWSVADLLRGDRKQSEYGKVTLPFTVLHDLDMLKRATGESSFYNAGISTYFWILTNREDEAHKDEVILLDTREHVAKMRKSLGGKRIPDEDIAKLTELYGESLTAAEYPEQPMHEKVKLFAPRDCGDRRTHRGVVLVTAAVTGKLDVTTARSGCAES